jgi:hypothetical protein
VAWPARTRSLRRAGLPITAFIGGSAMSRVRTRRTSYVSALPLSYVPEFLAGTAGFEPATSRLTVEVSQSFTPLLVTVEARTNRYTFERF